MSRPARIILGFVPLVILFAVVFWFSSNDSTRSSEQSGMVVEFIKDRFFSSAQEMENPEDYRIFMDILTKAVRKGAHFSIYALMGAAAVGGLWFLKRKGLRYLSALGICCVYAITDEIHQSFVPGRSCEVRDVIIDTCGSALGGAVCIFIVWVLLLRKTAAAYSHSKNTSLTEELS